VPPPRRARLFILLCGILSVAAVGATSARAGDDLAGLQADLSHQLALAGPADGAFVYDITAKKTLFSERATTLRAPASVEKLYTATTALEKMGPTARLTTNVYGIGHLASGGVWEGSLYLHGGGDPTFGSSSFIASHYGGLGASVTTLATQLVRADGIHTITGSIEGDESFFDSRRGDPSSNYEWDPWLEGTLSALAFNRGATGPETGPHAPAAYAARELWAALKNDGVKIAGRNGAATTPAHATLLASAPSPTIAQLLGLMLPPSDNFFAETLVKDIGALYGGAGTTAAGATIVADTIDSMFGFRPQIVDGSGLSRVDHTSPYEVVQLLADLSGTSIGAVLREHLAIAGHTGTLSERMVHSGASGRCVGKTGTLEGVSNLVGYCQSASGHQIAFAIFTDNIPTESAHTFQDHMTITIADSDIESAELARTAGLGPAATSPGLPVMRTPAADQLIP
jgi:serine-type D-Ala-D-Ala carboxypeptidase/endopeptidase (penicillin-binding protein 4)